MNYLTKFPPICISLFICYGLTVGGFEITPLDMRGLWLPVLLWVFAQHMFVYFYVTYNKYSGYATLADASKD